MAYHAAGTGRGAIASLLARSQRSAREAGRRARDTETLLDLGRATRGESVERLPAAICAWIVRDFHVQSCVLFRLDGEEFDLIRRRCTTTGLAKGEPLEAAAIALQRERLGCGHRRLRRVACGHQAWGRQNACDPAGLRPQGDLKLFSLR